MASVNWPTILVGSVLTAALTLLGQLLIQRRQHRLTQEMTEWNARRERADKIARLVGHIYVAVTLFAAGFEMETVKAQLLELRQLMGDVAEDDALGDAISRFDVKAEMVADSEKRGRTWEQDYDIWGNLKKSFDEVNKALKQYCDGKPESIGMRIRRAFHLPPAVRE